MKTLTLQLLLFLAFCASGIINAQNNEDIIGRLQKKVPVWLFENHVPAAGIGVIEEGKIKYLHVFGELKAGVSAPDNAYFSVASITKPVVAMLTLKLVESGQWNFDEPLANYWVDPEVANDPFHKKLTTRHVLNHQSGFPNWGKRFMFEPGTDYTYSGEGFQYLKKAMENKFQTSLAVLVDSILFKPLGMNDSYLRWNDNIDESRFACRHDNKGNICKPPIKKGRGVNAAASLITTVEDLCKFSISVMNGFGLSTDLYNEMTEPHVKLKAHYAKGLGWEVFTELPKVEYALEHSGSEGGVKTIFFLLPKSKSGMVILTNGDNGVLVYNKVINEYGKTGQMLLSYLTDNGNHKAIALTNDILDRYVGDYLDSGGRNLSIYREDNKLMFSGNSLPTVQLIPESENNFFLTDFDVQFEFVNNDSLVLIETGKIGWTAKKIIQKPVINLSDEILERYIGLYFRTDDKTEIKVIKGEGSSLKMSGTSVPPMDLLPTSDNMFFAQGFPFQFEFVNEEPGNANQINVIGDGKIVCEMLRKDEN
jgi:CubicO group peptidase (beta-lactamase class C family)